MQNLERPSGKALHNSVSKHQAKTTSAQARYAKHNQTRSHLAISSLYLSLSLALYLSLSISAYISIRQRMSLVKRDEFVAQTLDTNQR